MDTKSQPLDYLCVDRFMVDFVSARALTSALEIGLIDDLLQFPSCSFDKLNSRLKIEPRGLSLLIGLLRTSRVINQQNDSLMLTKAFIDALQYRDLLEAKLYFANLVAPDFINLFTALITNPRQFFEQAKIFELFSYQRCFQANDQNYSLTARWMQITTALTKYEALVCMSYYDFSRHRHQLDFGGNSGEFALRICKANPNLHAIVYDLPLVCDIGVQHIGTEPEAARIGFFKVNGSEQNIPQGFDLITFKSMLHDWPDHEMEAFLAKAYDSLDVGGTLLIFERGQMEIVDALPDYSIIPFLLFFRSYRLPEHYKACLENLGFNDIEIIEIQLETLFILITARK